MIALALVFALGFLTKISILALAPALAIALIFRPGRSIKTRMHEIMLASLVVIFSVFWYPLDRLVFEPENETTMTLGNGGMDQSLSVLRDPEYLLTFNPVEIVRHPFNDPWDDTFRRNYFPEYFFRSAFFGEYKFDRYKPLAQTLLVLAVLLLPAILFGMIIDIRRRWMELLPFHVATFGMLLGAFFYPYFFAFAPNQDFRFSVIFILPVAYYAVRGIEALPKWPRIIWTSIFAAFVLVAFCFIGALFVNA
jgi:hypothetical protein